MKRRVLGVSATLVLLLLGLVMVPKALGWRTATVDSYTAGTYYPQTVTSWAGSPAPLLSCEQTSGTTIGIAQLNLPKKVTGVKAKYYSCTNNWGTDVTFTITIVNSGTSGLSLSGATATIPAGQTKCVDAFITTGTENGGNVLYGVTATATDLSATLQFAGAVGTPGTDSPQCAIP